MNTCLNTMKDQ